MGKPPFKQGAITQLIEDDENFVTTDKEILNQCEVFYRNLYNSKIGTPNEKYDHIFFEASTAKKLNQVEQDSCEVSLTRAECLKALKEMDSNKTPGSDGSPAEFDSGTPLRPKAAEWSPILILRGMQVIFYGHGKWNGPRARVPYVRPSHFITFLHEAIFAQLLANGVRGIE